MIYGFGIFSAFIIALELFTGFAVIGWTGDNMLVEKEKSPGPYWFAITVQLLIFVGFGLIYFFAI
jgi:hypothetical protein